GEVPLDALKIDYRLIKCDATGRIGSCMIERRSSNAYAYRCSEGARIVQGGYGLSDAFAFDSDQVVEGDPHAIKSQIYVGPIAEPEGCGILAYICGQPRQFL